MPRKNPFPATKRTLEELRKRGATADVVERWVKNPAHPAGGVRKDFLGIIDIISLEPGRGFVGVQSCTTDFAGHLRTLTETQRDSTEVWLRCGGYIELWGWRKLQVKRGGKAFRWTPRVQVITLADLALSQLATLSGYTSTGGGFKNGLSYLRTRGLIEGRDTIDLTPAGRDLDFQWEALPRGRALLDYWSGKLDRAPRLALETLFDAYPVPMSRDELARRTGYEATGGGFKNGISRLRTLELAEGGPDAIVCTAMLHEEMAAV